MPRSLAIRAPTAREIRQLHLRLTEERAPRVRRRAEAILLHAAGMPATDIAAALGVHPYTIYADLHAFARSGLRALEQFRPAGAPARLQPAERAAILALAARAPSELGLPYGRWTLATLRTYLLRHRLVRAISREHLRRVLKKGGSGSGGSSASSSATTPSGARS